MVSGSWGVWYKAVWCHLLFADLPTGWSYESGSVYSVGGCISEPGLGSVCPRGYSCSCQGGEQNRRRHCLKQIEIRIWFWNDGCVLSRTRWTQTGVKTGVMKSSFFLKDYIKSNYCTCPNQVTSSVCKLFTYNNKKER